MCRRTSRGKRANSRLRATTRSTTIRIHILEKKAGPLDTYIKVALGPRHSRFSHGKPPRTRDATPPRRCGSPARTLPHGACPRLQNCAALRRACAATVDGHSTVERIFSIDARAASETTHSSLTKKKKIGVYGVLQFVDFKRKQLCPTHPHSLLRRRQCLLRRVVVKCLLVVHFFKSVTPSHHQHATIDMVTSVHKSP